MTTCGVVDLVLCVVVVVRDGVIVVGGAEVEVEVLEAGSAITMRESSVLVLREYLPPTVEPDHSVAASVAASVASATAARK